MTKIGVLVLCTGNSARSQMGEGLFRVEGGAGYEVSSAGTRPSSVRPEALAVMREIGIDISAHRSKSIEEFAGQPFDFLVTVCDSARDACPVFPGAAVRLHWSLEDPAAAAGTEEERLAAFRRIRDQLRERVRTFVRERARANLNGASALPSPRLAFTSAAAVAIAHGLAGWALCGATMGVGLKLTTVATALILHAIAAPGIFTAVSLAYFRRPVSWSPLLAATTFLGVVIVMDVGVVALLVERSFAMFGSVLGTWLPFLLIFVSTWWTGTAVRRVTHRVSG